MQSKHCQRMMGCSTCRPAVDNVIVIPADVAGLVVADELMLAEAQVRCACPWVAEAPRA